MATAPSSLSSHPQPSPSHPSIYRPLAPEEIRLLERVHKDGLVSWRFKHVLVHDCGNYFAISYRWSQDQAEPQPHVVVDGTALQISTNVAEVFHCLQAFDHADLIWIDSLCINQADQKEKMHQIPLMGKIYSQASLVIVYLGQSVAPLWPSSRPEGSEEEAQVAGAPDLDLPNILRIMTDEMLSDSVRTHVQYKRTLPAELLRCMHTLCHLMAMDWWTRLWTMQEYVLARDVKFVYGNNVIEDSVLRRFIDRYHELNLSEVETLMDPRTFKFSTLEPPNSTEPTEEEIVETLLSIDDPDARTALSELQFLRRDITATITTVEEKLWADLRIITSSFRRHATVGQDKILGLLGMLRSEIFNTIPLQINTAPEIIFEYVARGVLTNPVKHENLSLLHYVDTMEKLPSAPSWVPNFHSRLRTELLSSYWSPADFLYSASQDPPAVEELSSGAIRLQGRVVGVVDSVVQHDTFAWNLAVPHPLHLSCESQLEFEKACQKVSASVVKRHLPNKAQLRTAAEAYCSTLVAASRRQGTSHTRWAPGLAAYRKFMKRMDTLAGYSAYDFINNSRNPGSKQDTGFIFGRHKNPDMATERGNEGDEFHQRFFEVCKGRTFFSSDNGLVGLGPSVATKGDVVVIFHSGRTPFLVRTEKGRQSASVAYRLLGEVFIHGLMDGEAAFQGSTDNFGESSWFELA